MLDHIIAGREAWVGADLRRSDWLLRLPTDCLAELDAVVARLRRNPLPAIALRPEDFDLAACRGLIDRVRGVLDDGARFAVIDRLPVERLSRDEAVTLYWLLSSLLCRPVAQKLDGTLLYDVHDTGQQALPGSGIRPDKTNTEITFHNDNAYNTTPPHYVGLLFWRTAKAGGLSRLMSVYTAHNALLRDHADALPRLYEPFWFDRQREHRADDDPVLEAPIFEQRDGLKARFALHQIKNAHAMRGRAMDNATHHAVGALEAVFANPALAAEMLLERGQIQYVNNREIGHCRTAFVDHDVPDERRHLVRMWLREFGDRGYNG
ncbi:MAG: TauD/TfdA family dioxygenase [Proteobacteria bacterium]|nr:TauD/TfdA family dioxygenase [Pseudomonadota bacterium]